ncbi:MAG: hypothetical protein J6Y20_03030 [Lachnospiraceae bacterium]|nr:hypothetical protein [Lachnospiraceae bacterium]
MSDNYQDRVTPLSIEKDSQINVVVNRPDGEESGIDLMRVFHVMRVKRRVYAWVLILCMVLGMCAPLLMYQWQAHMVRVSSVVTLNYKLPSGKKVSSLTAPDGKELDLSQLTSAYVLQGALDQVSLPSAVTVSRLRDNIRIDRILTEESRRQQEVASKMLQDKTNAAYTQLQSVKLTYINQFIVALDNGFGGVNLSDSDLRNLLDQVLKSYNAYLAKTYADMYLPADEVSIIDVDSLDVMESLDLLRDAMDNLYSYCDSKPKDIRAYRSWSDGRSLEDLKVYIETLQSVNVDYLYSYVYANSIAEDRNTMISKYQYRLRNAQQSLAEINGNIATMKAIIDSYKPDQIFVDNQSSDTTKATKVTTDYYNQLVLELASDYRSAASLEIRIADLEDKISALQTGNTTKDIAEAKEELRRAIDVCSEAYRQVYDHMQEIVERPFYTTYLEFSSAQGEAEGFLGTNVKKMAVGAVAGAFIACGLWFVSAFVAELKRANRRVSGRKEVD